MKAIAKDLKLTGGSPGTLSLPRRSRMKTNTLNTLTAAQMLVTGAAHVTSGAELQERCRQPPATVIEMNPGSKFARASQGKVHRTGHHKGVPRGLMYTKGAGRLRKCIRQTKLDLLGHEMSAEANCAQGTLRLEGLGRLLCSRLPVHGDCATGGIFAVPTFKMLCPQYRGKDRKSIVGDLVGNGGHSRGPLGKSPPRGRPRCPLAA